MRTNCISDTDFRGKLVIVNELSNKPKKCIQKVQDDIQKLVKPKDYNLFIQQDYSKNEMRIIADYPFPLKRSQLNQYYTRTQINIPVDSKASKYIATSKNVMSEFESNLHQTEQQAWEQEQKRKKKEDIKDTLEIIVLSPLIITEAIIRSISPKWAKKFEKLLEKIGI